MSNNNGSQPIWTHGHHLEVEHPDRTNRIIRRGRSILVEGKSDQSTWLHGTVATVGEPGTQRIRAWVRVRSLEGAALTAIHVWDGDRRIGRIDTLLASSQEWQAIPLEICLSEPIRWGIGISIRVKFGQSTGSAIEVSTIGCEFFAQCAPAIYQTNPVVVASERFPILGDNGILFQPCASQFGQCSHQLFTHNPAVTRIVFSFHGVGANANRYCQRMANAASAANATDETLIVAPQFLNLYDENEPVADILEVLAAEDDLLYWTGGRVSGNRSANHPDFPRKNGQRISSFTAIDQMLRHCVESGLFPNLKTLVLAGQSGGGQIVHRYAASSPFTPPDGIQIRYIPMNPGSYLYLSNRRHHPQGSHPVAADAAVTFAVPDYSSFKYLLTWAHGGTLPTDSSFDLAAEKAKVRQSYNAYGLGLEKVIDMHYHKAAYGTQNQVENQIRENYQKRAIVHLVGELDNLQEPSPNDTGIVLHGRSRLERARLYRRHLMDENLWNPGNHVLREVEGVGHDGGKMMLSDESLWYIFGYGSSSNSRGYSSELESLRAEVWLLARFLERMRTRQPVVSGGQRGERTFTMQLERTRAALKDLRQSVERLTGRYPEPSEPR